MITRMDPAPQFSHGYLALLDAAQRGSAGAREAAGEYPPVSEKAIQTIWYDQALHALPLRTREGHTLEVVSPGWWNHHAGPDFRGAQVAFNGDLFTGDVEVHLGPEAWIQHGHHIDPRYDNVILHVVLDGEAEAPAAKTASGRHIPMLVLRKHLDPGWEVDAHADADDGAVGEGQPGACSQLIAAQGAGPLIKALELAAEWRLLTKARALRERIDRAGGNQALYEMLMYAAGFSTFKHHFQAIARQLPYERAVQLAHVDPLLLEAAFLQLAGLLPDDLPQGTTAVPHFARLRALRHEHLGGMRPLPLIWKRVALRPANYPERRLAGMARVLSITRQAGLLDHVMAIWRAGLAPKQSREAFEKCFPSPLGFWATHYTWTGKALDRAAAPLGNARVHSIIGNVFLPAGLAIARQHNDRPLEEHLFRFFQTFPKEADNHVLERIQPRLLGESGAILKSRFQLQQGMLQFYHDWCGPNPSCRNCTMHRYLDQSPKQ